ncbi:MAG: flagellar hook-length control protein FliK [Moritella sp.]|uniref:flagellar hook-length control protein FliK n=1 Tax=Moritella sp. TaxID=78556 RepID=UPI0029ADA2E4|nr:flagellar hook-length control protein FliK [Moritella sp.]MDX2321420.1 flagellar hook-length control protein FliK [Moritella sp.]
MTFSLHKSPAMTDTPAANKQPQSLNTESDASVDMSAGAEPNAPEGSFSKLFSLFNHENKTDLTVGSKNTLAASNSKDGLGDDMALLNTVDDAIIETEVDDTITDNTLSDDTIADDMVTQAGSQPESSDDFLARLGQSSMLLQEKPAIDLSTQAQHDTNGNKLPVQVGEANIALAADTVADPQAYQGQVSEFTDSELIIAENDNGTEKSAANLVLAMDQTAEVQANNPLIVPDATLLAPIASAMTGGTEGELGLSKADTANSESLTAKTGLLDSGKLDAVNVSSFSATLAEVAGGKNIPFGQANIAADNNTNSESDLLPTTPAEPIEQLDFAQIMESARKPEPLEQATRTMPKAPVLTDAEQQVLEKRVNLNNNLASSELNEKIAIMAGKELQSATIRLDPAELGSMNIKLVVQNDQLNVTIQTQSHQSRDLLEQQLPKLREMLQQQGMTLGDTQVQADSGQQQQSAFQQSRQENGQKNSNNEANYAIDPQTEVPVTTQYWQDSAKGVDFYA